MGVSRMLTGHELFQSFLPQEVANISQSAAEKKLDRGEVVCSPDRKATHVFVLLEGQVELRLPFGGNDEGPAVSRIGKGELFGIAPLVGAGAYTARAVCARSSRVLFIEARPLIAAMKANPVVGQAIMTKVAGIYFERYLLLLGRVQRALDTLLQEE